MGLLQFLKEIKWLRTSPQGPKFTISPTDRLSKGAALSTRERNWRNKDIGQAQVGLARLL
jgi:hypothetical protein